MEKTKISTFNNADINELKKIVDESSSFYVKEENVEGKKYYIFNYGIADIDEFIKFAPYSFEFRGLTIDAEDGEIFLSLHKFFNQNENIYVSNIIEENFEVREKVDGSLIQPIYNLRFKKYPVRLKTKGTFYSEQALEAMKFLEDKKNIMKFILEVYYEYNYIPLFEYISPKNQIVVQYPNSNLILLQIRDLNTGKYLNYDSIKNLAEKYNVPYVKVFEYTYNELRDLQLKEIGIEGWVIQRISAENYLDFRKIKTKWYLDLHRIISPDNLKEHIIIRKIIEETIDDVMSNLNADSIFRKEIEELIHLLNKHIKYHEKKIVDIINKDKKLFETSPKDFVDKYKTYEYFSVLIRFIKAENIDAFKIIEFIKKEILKRTNKYSKAKDFIKKIKVEIK